MLWAGPRDGAGPAAWKVGQAARGQALDSSPFACARKPEATLGPTLDLLESLLEGGQSKRQEGKPRGESP